MDDCRNEVHCMPQVARKIIGFLLGLAFSAIGYRHFAAPEGFNAIVPAYLGAPWFWTYASGVLEIALGVGITVPRTRPMAARLLLVLVILMSLANLNMWINDIPFNGTRLSTTGHMIRWLVQFILLALLLWLGEVIPRPNHRKESHAM